MNLANLATACAEFLAVWNDPHAQASEFGPVVGELIDALNGEDDDA